MRRAGLLLPLALGIACGGERDRAGSARAGTDSVARGRAASGGSAADSSRVSSAGCGVPAPSHDAGAPAAREVVVTRGARGMAAQTRWTLSADRCAMVAVEDWTSIEAEPFPDGALLAREGRRPMQVDSVWDAVPSPDFTRLAFGRARRVSAGERDSLTTQQWSALARAAGMPVADVRRGAFPASGMAVIVGFAQPGVSAFPGEARTFPVAAGWRVGWSADGSTLAAGTAPAPRIGDDVPAARWIALDPATGTPKGELPPAARLASVAWTEGPTIDISVAPDSTPRSIVVEGGAVESSDGRIRLGARLVGPGIALAATRTGRYILALAPNPAAKEYEARYRLVVYALDA